MRDLVRHSIDSRNRAPEKVLNDMTHLAKKNQQSLQGVEAIRTGQINVPSAKDLVQIREWMIDYKKQNKSASKREIRKAAQAHFNVKIYK